MKKQRQKLPLSDQLEKVKGHVLIEVKDLKGNVVDKREMSNLIVSAFRVNMLHALGSGLPGTAYQMDRFELGTSGTAPAVGDVSVTAPGAGSVYVAITSAATPTGSDPNKVKQFQGTLAAGSGNGNTFQECGLLMTSNALVARQTFSAMIKSSSFTWTLTWTLTWP